MTFLRATEKPVMCNCVFMGSKATFFYVRNLETDSFAGEEKKTISKLIDERRLQMSLVNNRILPVQTTQLAKKKKKRKKDKETFPYDLKGTNPL